MNPGGPVEEAGKVASGLIDALKAQPAVLALTLANLSMLAFIFYALHGAAQYREKILNQVFENGKEMQQLLARCVVPTRTYTTEPIKPLGEALDPHKSLGDAQ
jgi:hypothetical protein